MDESNEPKAVPAGGAIRAVVSVFDSHPLKLFGQVSAAVAITFFAYLMLQNLLSSQERSDKSSERMLDRLDRMVLRMEDVNTSNRERDRQALDAMRSEMRTSSEQVAAVVKEIRNLHVTNLDILGALAPNKKPTLKKIPTEEKTK